MKHIVIHTRLRFAELPSYQDQRFSRQFSLEKAWEDVYIE